MNNLNLDKYLDIANKIKKEKGLETYIPLYPMLRAHNNKLYVGVLLTREDDKVWDISGGVIPEYWLLIDVDTETVVEFNKTAEKDFIIGEIIPKNINDKQKEISKYTVEKAF